MYAIRVFLPTALLSPGLSSRWIGSGSVCGVSGLGREMVPGDGDCLQTSQHSLDRAKKSSLTVRENTSLDQYPTFMCDVTKL